MLWILSVIALITAGVMLSSVLLQPEQRPRKTRPPLNWRRIPPPPRPARSRAAARTTASSGLDLTGAGGLWTYDSSPVDHSLADTIVNSSPGDTSYDSSSCDTSFDSSAGDTGSTSFDVGDCGSGGDSFD